MKTQSLSSKNWVLISGLALSLNAISCGSNSSNEPAPTNPNGNGSSGPATVVVPPLPQPGTDGNETGKGEKGKDSKQTSGDHKGDCDCDDEKNKDSDHCKPTISEWGTRGAGARLENAVAAFEFDCAKGAVETLTPDASGNFDAQGWVMLQGRDRIPARYRGSIRGGEMHLNVSYFNDGKSVEADYPLALNQPVQVQKCE